jgi:HEAT repeat protein
LKSIQIDIEKIMNYKPDEIDRLIALLKDEDWEVRKEAAEALGKIGDPRALPELERLARENSDASEKAREAIEKIKAR